MLRCTIEDDGVGFDISMLSLRFEKEGLGLVGIRDQVEILGGTLKVESAPHCGTRLTILIPVES
jgi:signal transduction histidine kinase